MITRTLTRQTKNLLHPNHISLRSYLAGIWTEYERYTLTPAARIVSPWSSVWTNPASWGLSRLKNQTHNPLSQPLPLINRSAFVIALLQANFSALLPVIRQDIVDLSQIHAKNRHLNQVPSSQNPVTTIISPGFVPNETNLPPFPTTATTKGGVGAGQTKHHHKDGHKNHRHSGHHGPYTNSIHQDEVKSFFFGNGPAINTPPQTTSSNQYPVSTPKQGLAQPQTPRMFFASNTPGQHYFDHNTPNYSQRVQPKPTPKNNPTSPVSDSSFGIDEFDESTSQLMHVSSELGDIIPAIAQNKATAAALLLTALPHETLTRAVQWSQGPHTRQSVLDPFVRGQIWAPMQVS